MKYVCNNGHVFTHAAKKTLYDFNALPYAEAVSTTYIHPADSVPVSKTETNVCPFCQSLVFNEYVEPQPQVEAVYVHDLTTGMQDALNEKLKEGWVITYRTSKQYVLEKTKEVEVKSE